MSFFFFSYQIDYCSSWLMTFSTPLTDFNLMLLCTTQQKPVKVSGGLCIAFRLPACLSCVFYSAAIMKKWQDILFKVIVWLSLLRELTWLSLDFQLPCLFYLASHAPSPFVNCIIPLFLCSQFTTSSKLLWQDHHLLFILPSRCVNLTLLHLLHALQDLLCWVAYLEHLIKILYWPFVSITIILSCFSPFSCFSSNYCANSMMNWLLFYLLKPKMVSSEKIPAKGINSSIHGLVICCLSSFSI